MPKDTHKKKQLKQDQKKVLKDIADLLKVAEFRCCDRIQITFLPALIMSATIYRDESDGYPELWVEDQDKDVVKNGCVVKAGFSRITYNR